MWLFWFFFLISVISFLGLIFSLKLCISMVNYDSFQSNFAVLLVLVFGWQLLSLDAKHESAVEMVCVLERIKWVGATRVVSECRNSYFEPATQKL